MAKVVLVLVMMGILGFMVENRITASSMQQFPYKPAALDYFSVPYRLDSSMQDSHAYLPIDSIHIVWKHQLQADFASNIKDWKSKNDIHDLVYRKPLPPRWPVFLILFMLIIIALIKQIFPTIWARHLNVLINNRGIRTYLRFQTEEVSSFGLFITLFSCLAYALSLREVLWQNGLGLTDYISGDLILLTFLLFLGFVIKLLLFSMGGYIYGSSSYATTWVSITIALNLLLSLVLLPFSALMHLQVIEIDLSILTKILATVYALVWFYRLFRLLWQDSSRFEAGVFYLFLYFCTLEIGPMLFVLKFVELKLK